MSLLRFIPELPLLRRELIELSNRRRTYVVRFVGSIIVLSYAMYLYQQAVDQVGSGMFGFGFSGRGQAALYNPNRYFGSGAIIFPQLVPMLFRCVQFLMPALVCSSIALEKERNTLGTLFVTRLTPMTIVFEKLCSRLVPMFTFLLLTFPVLAFVYSLGGVDTVLLLSTLWLIFCECLLFACIGLMCSSWFATTVTAFIWSYAITGLLVLTAQLLPIPVLSPYNVWRTQSLGFVGGGGWATMATGLGFAPPGALRGISASGDPAWFMILRAMFGVVVMSIPSLMAAGFCLLMARVFLIRRAFVSSSSMLLKLFKRVDTFFVSINNTRLTRGIVLVKDHNSLPLFDPVAWRERTKKSLGKARYLIRILIVIEGPILFICLIAATSMQTSNFEGLRGLLFFAWALAALMLAVKASTLMSSERTRETLDVLLSTPLTLKEILTQKIAGARRLMIVLAMPILTVNFTLLMMHFDAASAIRNGNYGALLNIAIYVGLVLASTTVMLHQLAWLATLLGLKSSSQMRSAMTALMFITGWVILGLACASPGGPIHQLIGIDAEMHSFASYLGRDYYGNAMQDLSPTGIANVTTSAAQLCLIRPDGCILANEAVLSASAGSQYGDGMMMRMLARGGAVSATFAALVVLVWHTGLMLLIRWITLRLAPRLLNRRDEELRTAVTVEEDAWRSVTLSEVPG